MLLAAHHHLPSRGCATANRRARSWIPPEFAGTLTHGTASRSYQRTTASELAGTVEQLAEVRTEVQRTRDQAASSKQEAHTLAAARNTLAGQLEAERGHTAEQRHRAGDALTAR